MSKIEQIRNNIRNHLEQKKRNVEEAYKRRNSRWNKYYQSHDWKQLRGWKIINSPLCENCLHYNIVTPATEVHHLSIFGAADTEERKWQLLLDPTNVRSLCSSCHDLYHNEMRRLHITEYRDYIEPPVLSANK